MQAHQQLEVEIGKWAGYPAENVVACSSGTAALHLALEAFQLPLGSECLCPDFTMIACPRAVTLAGLTPVFVDCGEDLLLDTSLLGLAVFGRISKNRPGDEPYPVRAVMEVAVYGRVNENDRQYVAHVAAKNNYRVIEDLAEAHGVKPHPATDAACWSFFANKHVHGEEGGAVAFLNREHAERARSLRCLGFTPEHDFYHIPRGHNYRLANSLASLILKSLGEFDAEMERRRRMEQLLNEACPPEWRMPARESPWIFDMRIPGMVKERQDRVVALLNRRGIRARHGFAPMHLQEEYKSCRRVGGERAEAASREVIYVPLEEASLGAFQITRSLY